MLPRELPTVDAFFAVTVAQRVNRKWHGRVPTDNTGNHLVRSINTWLVCIVCEDVVTNFCVARENTAIAGHDRGGSIIIQWP